MIKVESRWLRFMLVLFSLALRGICCKNSSWCNGTAYAKIFHKPLQSPSEVSHLVRACLRHVSPSFMNSSYFAHDNSEAVTHSVLSPCLSRSFSRAETFFLVYFWSEFKRTKVACFFFSKRIKDKVLFRDLCDLSAGEVCSLRPTAYLEKAVR